MDVDPRYKYKRNFRRCVLWYMMNSNEYFSNISFISKIENGELVYPSTNKVLLLVYLSKKPNSFN